MVGFDEAVLQRGAQVQSGIDLERDQWWSREKATLRDGRLERLEKEYVAFATAIASDAPYSVRLRKELLTRMGAGEEQLFEALEVVELFHKNTKFTEGLQLEPGLWSDSAGA